MSRFITIPTGHRVSLGTYVAIWKRVKAAHPEKLFAGWEWFVLPSCEILAAIRRGLHDRINRRGNLIIRESRAHPSPLNQTRDRRSRIEPSAWRTFSPAARKALGHRAHPFET